MRDLQRTSRRGHHRRLGYLGGDAEAEQRQHDTGDWASGEALNCPLTCIVADCLTFSVPRPESGRTDDLLAFYRVGGSTLRIRVREW